MDACAGHETAYSTYIAGHGKEYRILEQELLRVALGVAFHLDDDSGRAEALSAVLQEMAGDGTIAAILEKYGVDAAALAE